MPKDTTKEKTIWKINIDKLDLQRTALRLHMPGDTMVVGAEMVKAAILGTSIDLLKNEYKVRHIAWQGGSLSYDKTYEPKARQGFDAAHIALSKLYMGIVRLLTTLRVLLLTSEQVILRSVADWL